MLRRSIPQHDQMRAAVFALAAPFVRAGTSVIDLGCARGEALAPFVARFPSARCVGVEVSDPMLAAARDRFAAEIAEDRVRILTLDLRHAFPPGVASVVLAILTLQFVPVEHRQRVVQRMHDALRPGGVAIVVEKVLGATAGIDDRMVRAYHDLKRQNGYTAEEIDRKRFSLEGVLVPLTARGNEELLASAGFRQLDCFWAWCNFRGWIAVREGGDA